METSRRTRPVLTCIKSSANKNRLKHQAGTGDSLLRIDSAASGLGDQSHRAESQAGWRTRIYASDS